MILTILLAACTSEKEEIAANQKKYCKEQILAGKEPTEFCLSVLPEYRSMAVAPAQVITQPEQGFVQPQVQQAPVVVQSPAHQDSTMQDMLLGGLIGHTIGSAMADRSAPASSYAAPAYSPPVRRSVTNVTKNITIQQAPIVAKKPSYMDMSKLSSYGKRPATSSYSFTRSRR